MHEENTIETSETISVGKRIYMVFEDEEKKKRTDFVCAAT
jgi:hypothetical protein